jgi:hypothetical protein
MASTSRVGEGALGEGLRFAAEIRRGAAHAVERREAAQRRDEVALAAGRALEASIDLRTPRSTGRA